MRDLGRDLYAKNYCTYMKSQFITKTFKHMSYENKIETEQIMIGGGGLTHGARPARAKVFRVKG